MITEIINSFHNAEFKKMRIQARKFGLKRTYVEIHQHEKLSERDKLDMIYMIVTRIK